MTNQDFTTTVFVDQTPMEAFAAINNPRGWWSEAIEGGTEAINDQFNYHFGDVHRCSMRIIESVPEQKVVWLVLDNYFKFTKDKSEWNGTRISFDISRQGDKTKIRFTHQGLVPEYECYEICCNAWTGYIQGSLKNLIATGEGKPNKREAQPAE